MPYHFTPSRITFALLLLSAPLAFAKPNEKPKLAPATPTTIAPVGGLMGQEGLNATAWVQTAAEAKIAARQAYFLAAHQLDEGLKDPNWSAAVEQSLPFSKLPPAIILDLDETVLDNSFYQARLVRADAPYSSQSWGKWVAQADAQAIPGAAAFLKYANDKGVQIYYITNRSQGEEAATRENLRRLGLPIQGPADHVLTTGEQPDWTSDKTSRRRFVAQTNRVVLLVGDDLNDFVPAKPMSLQQRLDLLEKYSSLWGERWILLSNPLYGSWEGALFDYQNGLSRQEMLKRKYNAMQTREGIAAPVLPATSTATR
jgi:5'-nucleotidase (lipoprotein e(P4) family)